MTLSAPASSHENSAPGNTALRLVIPNGVRNLLFPVADELGKPDPKFDARIKIFRGSEKLLMTHAQHELQPAAGGLEKVIARAVRKAPAGDAPLLAWPVACGSAVAARTRALDFLDGILRVEVPDAGWRRELQALAPRYLAALNRYVVNSVTRIEFVVSAKR